MDTKANTSELLRQVADLERSLAANKFLLDEILSFSTLLTRTTDLSSLYRHCNRVAKDLLGLDFSTLMILTEDKKSLCIQDTIGFSESMIGTFALLKGQGLSTYIVEKKKPATVLDFSRESRFEVPPVVFEKNITSALSVPMMIGDRVFGVLIGHSLVKREFSSNEISLYQSLANQAAVAIDNAGQAQALNNLMSRFQTVMDSLDALVYVSDFETNDILFVNRYGREKWGSIVGEKCWQTIQSGQDGPCRFCTNTALLDKSGEPAGVIVRELKNTTDDEWYECRDQAIQWVDGCLVHMQIATNITGRKKSEKKQRDLEAKLARTEKMGALGLMAGGVAHDLNNILSGIVGYPDLILMQLPDDSKLKRFILAIKETGIRASEVVADLLTVARGSATEQTVENLNTLITQYYNSPECRTTRNQYPHITCSLDLDEELLNISCSQVHIKKCLMNLVNNASEAIEKKGEIFLSTSNRYIDRPLPGNQYMEQGEYVVLEVRDSGTGVSEKDLPHIFEPFYTKKILGRKGTGLGLAVVWNTVRDHGGGITIESGDEGTTFTLYFPANRERVIAPPKQTTINSLRGNGEKILIVDDESRQLDVAENMLLSLDYTVDCVDSGQAAVAYCEKNSVDLVLLDMIMEPGMNGRKTYERILQLHPGQKAVIASGFSDDSEVKRALQQGAGRFIKKPYTLKQLGRAVQETLRQA